MDFEPEKKGIDPVEEALRHMGLAQKAFESAETLSHRFPQDHQSRLLEATYHASMANAYWMQEFMLGEVEIEGDDEL